jgi:hypothetical protein
VLPLHYTVTKKPYGSTLSVGYNSAIISLLERQCASIW